MLFVCGEQETCDVAVHELAAAAPPAATLILSPADAAEGNGALQAKLAGFLAAQPHGVVVVHGVDAVSSSSRALLPGTHTAVQR